jgi:hypothetical protein
MSTVWAILRQQEYCGDVINFKTYSKSFKNKKRLENPEDNWKVFLGVHDPIIDRDTFELVQSQLGKTKHRKPKPENGEKSIFQACSTALTAVKSFVITSIPAGASDSSAAPITRVIIGEPVRKGTTFGRMPSTRW